MDDLVKALRSGEQADMDGTLVKVSRQACEEAADAIDALQAQLAAARDKALEDAAMLMQRHGFGGSAAAIRAMKGERG